MSKVQLALVTAVLLFFGYLLVRPMLGLLLVAGLFGVGVGLGWRLASPGFWKKS